MASTTNLQAVIELVSQANGMLSSLLLQALMEPGGPLHGMSKQDLSLEDLQMAQAKAGSSGHKRNAEVPSLVHCDWHDGYDSIAISAASQPG